MIRRRLFTSIFVWLTFGTASALEPSNPTTFCSRFIGEADIQDCEIKMKTDNSDWYAATICHRQEADTNFWACWNQIQGKSYSPQALQKCAEEGLSDGERTACLTSAQGALRSPASSHDKIFQPLKTKKKSR